MILFTDINFIDFWIGNIDTDEESSIDFNNDQ